MGSNGISTGAAAGQPAKRPVFVVCPAETITGGPELLHQLAALLRASGTPASVLYSPLSDQHTVPSAYRHYDVPVGSVGEITPDSIVIVPEIHAWLLPRLPQCQIYFWWLSVDNFRVGATAHWLTRLLPKPLVERIALGVVRRFADRHLCQSEYARIFACDHHLSPSSMLSDYLGAPYNASAASPPQGTRVNLILYNPAKGIERTRPILDQLAKSSPIPIEAVPIRNMGREEVVAHFGRAKVYIDFGNHPGKDRLPREAAALGCCVVTNRRGSAANAIDVPVPEEYKIEDSDEAFDRTAAEKIVDICLRFADHAPNFEAYRRIIAEEPELFEQQAAAIFFRVDGSRQPPPAAGG